MLLGRYVLLHVLVLADLMNPKSSKESREALIFLHIPKTAGTTLNRIIEWQYSPFAIFTMDPYRIRATSERFMRLPEWRRRRLRVVRGHMPYGIHEALPQGATYITMLREPVARVLSAYYFVLRRPLNPLHRKVKKERLTIEDCLRLFPERNNLQCQFIAGIRDPAFNDERLLEVAKENLARSFGVVGICERFDESVILMSNAFGWKVPSYGAKKVAKRRPVVESKVSDLIREHNRLDADLYEFGKKLFEQSLCKNELAVKDAVTELRSAPAHGKLRRSYRSAVGGARFLVNKVVSAL